MAADIVVNPVNAINLQDLRTDIAPDNLGANGIHGLGLPPYIAPGPPPGESLLDNHEAQNLNAFFSDFDSHSLDPNIGVAEGSQLLHGKNVDFELPPDYVGSETSLGSRYGPSIAPQDLQPGFYNDSLMLGHVPLIHQGNPLDGLIQPAGPGFMDSSLANPMQNNFQTLLHPPQYHQRWLPGYQSNVTPSIANSRPQVRFGSDDQFQASGYAAPPHHQEPDMMGNLDWIEAQSSATNTQPNTQPNTEPSSPTAPRKRKVDDLYPLARPANDHSGPLAQTRNIMDVQSESLEAKTSTGKPRKSGRKGDSASATTLETEPGPWPLPKPRPISPSPSAKRPSSRSKRKTLPNPEPAPSTSRSKPSRASSKSNPKMKIPPKSTKQPSRSSNTPGSHRKPLTQAEKKANHTNSEQRRRDATSRAYAEMYDLVPELDSMGKQSTTKKLECVVKKVRELNAGNVELERLLGGV